METHTIRDKIHTFRNIVSIISTGTSIASIISFLLTSFKIVALPLSSMTPIPIIALSAYLLLRFLPYGVGQIKDLLKKKNLDELTALEAKQIEEIYEIIEKKYKSTRRQPIIDNEISMYERRV